MVLSPEATEQDDHGVCKIAIELAVCFAGTDPQHDLCIRLGRRYIRRE